MSQYGSQVTEGLGTTVTTNGTAVITGSGTLWSTSPLVVAGNLFTIDGINYDIGSVDSETQLTLTSIFAGADGSGQSYVISSQFTANHDLPYPERGDVETAALNKRAMQKIDTALSQINTDGSFKHYGAGNGIYNGKMTISQRGDYTSATAVTPDGYYLDRWKALEVTISGTVQQVLNGYGNLNTQKLVVSSGTSGRLGMNQYIEQYADYANETITISTWVKSDNANARLFVYDGTYTLLDTHTGGGGWELLKGTYTVTGSPSALFVGIRFSDATAVGAATVAVSDYIEFTDVRLDLGSYRLSGDREYGEELALCQRYFNRINLNSTNDSLCNASAYSTTEAYGIIDFPLMRAAPTGAVSGATDYTFWANGASHTSTAATLESASESRIRLKLTVSGVTAGHGGWISSSDASKYVDLKSEL